MATLHLHTPWASDITLVPNCFLDRHMLQANGEFVKIYLYLLRCAPDSLPSLSMLADKMSCTERDILRAVRYWEKEGLLLLGLDAEQKISDISFIYPENTPKSTVPPAEDTADLSAGPGPESPGTGPVQGESADPAGPPPETALSVKRERGYHPAALYRRAIPGPSPHRDRYQ